MRTGYGRLPQFRLPSVTFLPIQGSGIEPAAGRPLRGESMFKITIDAMLLPSMFAFVAGLMVAGALANLSQDRLSQERQQPE